MKKTIAVILSALIIMSVLSACGGTAATVDEGGSVQIVTTIFPVYDWVREILGEDAADVELTVLLDSGVDLHSYQPTAADIMKISTCDLFIYVGGESDDWVGDALAESVNPDQIALNLLDVLGDSAKEEEIVEGMQAEEEEEETEYDEHIWLSLRCAQTLCAAIAEAIEQVDPDNAAAYGSNADAYIGELSSLEGDYAAVIASAAYDTLLFGDRFPFRYLADDYGLNYYAAFSGCAAETEASFETIVFLANKLDELGLPAILTIEGTDHSIADTIVSNTTNQNQRILVLDSMQGTTSADAAAGAAYLSIMEANLSVLEQALNPA